MQRILSIDDESLYHRMIENALKGLDIELHTAPNGTSGLKMARDLHPDLIISDLMMPDITGYDVTQTLRRLPEFAHTPIIILTSQAEIQDKIRSFEAGADDHVTKPFEPAELAARVQMLLRKSDALKKSSAAMNTPAAGQQAKFIAVHTLRGGIGCSSLAVNLALALNDLWEAPTLLVDLAFTAGSAALMLNVPLKRTWADITRFPTSEIDLEVIQSIIDKHESGLDLIAAPTSPADAEMLNGATFSTAVDQVRPYYEYIIADMPHDFSETALNALDAADLILLLMAPELASVRAAAAALNTYQKLGYGSDKYMVVLNSPFPRQAIPREKLEAALGVNITAVLPHVPDKFIDAINLGKPVVHAHPAEPIAALLEDFAFHLSKDHRKRVRPAAPSAAWKRVYRRFTERKK